MVICIALNQATVTKWFSNQIDDIYWVGFIGFGQYKKQSSVSKIPQGWSSRSGNRSPILASHITNQLINNSAADWRWICVLSLNLTVLFWSYEDAFNDDCFVSLSFISFDYCLYVITIFPSRELRKLWNRDVNAKRKVIYHKIMGLTSYYDSVTRRHYLKEHDPFVIYFFFAY